MRNPPNTRVKRPPRVAATVTCARSPALVRRLSWGNQQPWRLEAALYDSLWHERHARDAAQGLLGPARFQGRRAAGTAQEDLLGVLARVMVKGWAARTRSSGSTPRSAGAPTSSASPPTTAP